MSFREGAIYQIIKGVVLTVLFCLAAVLVFALLIKLFGIGGRWISIVNQIIKFASIFAACLLSVRTDRGIIKGAVIGLIGVAVTFLIFSLISGDVSVTLKSILDLLFGGLSGALGGIAAVNLRRANA